MPIPADFASIMRPVMGQEYELLEHELLYGEVKRGLRVNTLKISAADFARISPFALSPSSLCRDAFYIDEEDAKPGLHPYHHAGLYYIQDPSASAAVEALDPQPGEWVLDLCAAPGGKSTHIAARLANAPGSLLVANDIVPKRAKILSSNLERIGARNAVVCSASPDDFARICPQTFDAVLTDAPCSGEGMFRRDEQAVRDYSSAHVESCASRQKLILDNAAACVRPGGRLVYSTCTFNPYENEGVVEDFLRTHDDFSLAQIKYPSLPPARPEWVGARAELALAARAMPHLCPGEGHFIALLLRRGSDTAGREYAAEDDALKGREKEDFTYFWNENFNLPVFGTPCRRGGLVCIAPPRPALPHRICAGVCAAELMRGRIEPQHGIFLSLNMQHFFKKCILPPDGPEIAAFLRGESIKRDDFTGFGAVCTGTENAYWCVGFGKISGGTLKNHYPKGLRSKG